MPVTVSTCGDRLFNRSVRKEEINEQKVEEQKTSRQADLENPLRFFAFLFVFLLVAGPIANNHASLINMVLGIESSVILNDGDGEVADRFVCEFEDISDHEANAAMLVESVIAEGAVLMLNRDNTLPLNGSEKMTLLGVSSADFIYGGGSSGMDISKYDTLKTGLEADGFTVNPDMWSFYTEGAGKSYRHAIASGALNNYIPNNKEFLVNEVPMSEFTDREWDSVTAYGDAAIVVIGRPGSEGKDLPVSDSGDASGNYLKLTKEELDILAKLAGLKSAGSIQKIIVLLNGSNAMEMDFLEPEICGVDYQIDACLWVGCVGQTDISAIGDILNCNVNPSGRLVDTYCYDNTTSPAIQNVGVTAYTNAAAHGLSYSGTNNEYFVVYQEGIYVGYRYYETRYEDMVLGTANTGDYDYASTVAFPFGYGLHYTEMTYGALEMKDAGDTLTFYVDVTNTGDRDGRDSVLIYMQSPYTEYDRNYGIEKASVELVGFTKVSVPAGRTVKAKVIVDKQELRTYDANGQKTYIVDSGNYYFSVGDSAHDALNSILLQKAAQNDTSWGKVDLAKIIGSGDASNAVQYVQKHQDNTTWSMAGTGAKITNQLDHIDLNKYDTDTSNDVVYVSRSDWDGTMPHADLTPGGYKAAFEMACTDGMAADLKAIPGSDGQGTMPFQGKEGTLNLAQFIGVPLDKSITLADGNSYTWDDLLDQVTVAELAKMIGTAYSVTAPAKSINKPATIEKDGPMGITAKLIGGASSTGYTSEDILAATFDVELVEKIGESFGNDCLLSSNRSKCVSGVYAPGVNTHRTPYSGRNFEYYSEDPFVSGVICSAEVRGLQSKGVYVFMKHFALNDQETGRDGISVWCNEQTAREIYLQAFEYPIVDADAMCVMTSFNRIGTVWAGGDKNLLTNVLRGEWGMKGMVQTDFSNNNNYMDVIQGVLAGGDIWCCNDASKWTPVLEENANDPAVLTAMRKAGKHILYTVANSNAMNGMGYSTTVIEVREWWRDAILYAQIASGAMAVGFLVLSILSSRKAKKKASETA